jgi:hypothetical protein
MAEIPAPGREGMVANVAQLVEQRFRKARVAGSIPVVGSIRLLLSVWRPFLLS